MARAECWFTLIAGLKLICMYHTSDFSGWLAAKAELKECGLKVTRIRLSLLTILMRAKGALTSEELFGEVNEIKCNQVTVYRALRVFLRHGLVTPEFKPNGARRYRYRSEEPVHNHHVTCLGYGQSTEIDTCNLEDVKRLVERQGFSNVTHSLDFYGWCGGCRGTMPNNRKAR